MSSSLSPGGRGAYQAFTLIELLTVIAIIGILAAITFGVIRGVRERAAIGRAKSELAAVAQSLAAYKRQYGDYPQSGINNAAPDATSLASTDAQYILFNSLVGKLGPKGAKIEGRAFVELAKLKVLSDLAANQPDPTGDDPVENGLIDPWGRLYLYAYRASNVTATTTAAGANWPVYVLYSAGPDGKAGVTVDPTTGAVSVSADGADNIFANQ